MPTFIISTNVFVSQNKEEKTGMDKSFFFFLLRLASAFRNEGTWFFPWPIKRKKTSVGQQTSFQTKIGFNNNVPDYNYMRDAIDLWQAESTDKIENQLSKSFVSSIRRNWYGALFNLAIQMTKPDAVSRST